MSDQYDLIEDDTEKLEKYQKINKILEVYSGFPIPKYDDMNGATDKCDKILDKIVQILLSYPFNKGKNKSIFKDKIIDLIKEPFDSNQPPEILKVGNRTLYWNHFLIYLSNKLEEIKKI